ncbi:MAG: hypothetical protein H8E37_06810 [Planctomycetes bacterium]|nr:hypothetical protein [Planctomycetota bacterium]
MRFLCLSLFCLGILGCDSDDPPGIASDEPALLKLLDHYDEQFDPGESMLRQEFSSPGYHTRFETGDLVHTTRESLIYALALLKRGEPEDVARAEAILEKIVALQDSDSESTTFGVWPWLLEEPIAEMTSPDLNWADFCGASLAHILIQHSGQLSEETRQLAEAALRNATAAIRKRNVGPGYTNIAVLGGGVCAAAGEVFADAELLKYGRERLQGVVEQTAKHGGFNEYNSPPYCKVVIAECERILELVEDPATRTAAESIHTEAWRMIAGSLHLPTQQLAAPHSRSSRNLLRVAMVDFLNRRTGLELKPHPSMLGGKPRGYGIVKPLMCPKELLTELQAEREYPLQIERVFVNSRRWQYRRVGTTWSDEASCLGTANRSSFWTQRKPLLAYWKTADDPAVVLRLRFLHDGRDFASMGVRSVQDGPRVLSTFYPIENAGSWHPSLDRPAEGLFEAKDLRVRYELIGKGVLLNEPGEGRFELVAGTRRVVLQTTESVTWHGGRGEDRVFVDGVFFSGGMAKVSVESLPKQVLVALELLSPDQSHAKSRPQFLGNDIVAKWKWGAGPEDVLTIPAD